MSEPLDPVDPMTVMINALIVALEAMLSELEHMADARSGVAQGILNSAKSEMDAYLVDHDFDHITKCEQLMIEGKKLLDGML